MSAPPLTFPEVLPWSRAAARIGATVDDLRKAAARGLVPDRGRCGRARVVYASDLPAIEQRMRAAGILRDPDGTGGTAA